MNNAAKKNSHKRDARVSTYFALIAEFGTAEILLEDCCESYFGMDIKTARIRAASQKLPVPVYRPGSQKSSYRVSAGDLAAYLDELKEEARREHKALNDARGDGST